uniref:N-terminal Ras-GEF domain-containing protein n=1 Tax=Rhodnius prolixus TaxID=13249 RepID=T1HQT4_RHOPR
MSDTSSVTMPQSIKNDPKLFKDDVDIRFSRTLNSCKVPQIRYATPERLLERLTDLRFLSIDFLNTFLLTYRVFTDGVTVLEALKKVFYNSDPPDFQGAGDNYLPERDDTLSTLHLYNSERRRSSASPRRTSGASSVSVEEEQMGLIKETSGSPKDNTKEGTTRRKVSIRVVQPDKSHLTIPETIAGSSSAETLTGDTVVSAPSSPSNQSTATLVGSNNSSENQAENGVEKQKAAQSPKHTTSPAKEEVPSKDDKATLGKTAYQHMKRSSWDGNKKGETDVEWEEEAAASANVGSRSASIVSSATMQ